MLSHLKFHFWYTASYPLLAYPQLMEKRNLLTNLGTIKVGPSCSELIHA